MGAGALAEGLAAGSPFVSILSPLRAHSGGNCSELMVVTFFVMAGKFSFTDLIVITQLFWMIKE